MITIREIQRATADHFGLQIGHMVSRSRLRLFSRPRQVGMYLAVQLTGEPLQVIARLFEHDRTTVRHAAHVIHRLRRRNSFMEEHDTKCGDAIDQIIAKLRGAA